MEKNEILTGTITSYGSDGEGIIKEDGKTIFIPFTIPGEKVRYRILKLRKNITFGKAEEIITPAEERVRPECHAFGKCGGCQLMHLNYNAQLVFKHDAISRCFKKIAFLIVDPKKTVASNDQLHYRNKIQLPIRQTVKGKKVGFFAVNSHRIVPIDDCPIHGEWCKSIISSLVEYMDEKDISAYDEGSRQGVLKHIVVKKIGEEFIIILVVNDRLIKDVTYFERLLTSSLKSPFSLFLNINTRNDNVILTDEFIKISGNDFVRTEFLGIKYSVGPASFMQVNDYIKSRLYQKVRELVSEDDSIIDAYCGTGLLTALLAKKCKKAIGIEIVNEAIDCANKMAVDNGIENISFVLGDCAEVLPDIIRKNKKATVILDPPRKGLDRKVVETILKCRPEHIIYISCNPQTLARDTGILAGTLKYEGDQLVKAVENPISGEIGEVLPSGYYFDYLRGYDMFAQCKGVETLCSLKLKEE